MQSTPVTLSKLDAMQRQLDTAIHLWFAEADPVSIHTLASAAHELLHALYKKQGLSGLLFDFPNVKEEYRSFMAKELKKYFNFFNLRVIPQFQNFSF